jgi:hypothetical protein
LAAPINSLAGFIAEHTATPTSRAWATAAHYNTRAEAIRAINARNVRTHRTRGFWVDVNAEDGDFTVRWMRPRYKQTPN